MFSVIWYVSVSWYLLRPLTSIVEVMLPGRPLQALVCFTPAYLYRQGFHFTFLSILVCSPLSNLYRRIGEAAHPLQSWYVHHLVILFGDDSFARLLFAVSWYVCARLISRRSVIPRLYAPSQTHRARLYAPSDVY